MCIGVYTLEHPDYALILATNRDEFLHRPTEDAHWHSFGHATASSHGPADAAPISSAIAKTASTTGNALSPSTSEISSSPDEAPILSGRDLQAGGTWLGLSRAGGRIALLTNITEPLAKWRVSRGELVAGFLTMEPESEEKDEKGRNGDALLDQWEDKMGVNRGGGKGEYAGFNLLLLEPRVEPSSQLQGASRVVYDARFVTNHGGGGPLTSRYLSDEERQCGGISNGIDHSRVVHPHQNKHAQGSCNQETVDDSEKEVVTNDASDEWPKVRRARADFSTLFRGQDGQEEKVSEDALVERLFDVLEWHPTPQPVAHRGELRTTVHVLPVRIGLPSVTPAPTSPGTVSPDIRAAHAEVTIPPTATGTGPDPSTEIAEGSTAGSEALASRTETPPAFYGTRLATIVLIPRDPAHEALFIERDIWALESEDPESSSSLRNPSAEKAPIRVDKSRQRVFRFKMVFGAAPP